MVHWFVGHDLGIEGEDVFNITSKRLSKDDVDLTYGGSLLTVDDSVMLLERCDWEALFTEQQSVRQKAANRRTFVGEYKKKSIATLKAAAKAKARGRRRANPGDGPVIVPRQLAQCELGPLCPPGAHIWAAHSREGWCGHMPPRKRCSARFQDHGFDEHEAARALLRMLWDQYAEINARDRASLVNFQ